MSAQPTLHRLEGLSPRAFEHPADRAATAALKSVPGLDTVVLRVFNPNPQPEALTLSLPARRIRLDEEQDVDGGLELAPGEIATFLLA